MKGIKEILDQVDRLLSARRIEEAVQLASRALGRWTGDPTLLRQRAFAYAQRRDFARAIDDINQAIAHGGEEPDYYFNRGRWHFAAAMYREAIGDCDRVVQLGNELNHAYYSNAAVFLRALAYYESGDYAACLRDCERIEDSECRFWFDKRLYRKSEVVAAAEAALERDRRI